MCMPLQQQQCVAYTKAHVFAASFANVQRSIDALTSIGVSTHSSTCIHCTIERVLDVVGAIKTDGLMQRTKDE